MQLCGLQAFMVIIEYVREGYGYCSSGVEGEEINSIFVLSLEIPFNLQMISSEYLSSFLIIEILIGKILSIFNAKLNSIISVNPREQSVVRFQRRVQLIQ